MTDDTAADDTTNPKPSAKDVAAWMMAELDEHAWLYQDQTVWRIRTLFGDEFYYQNDNGNLAIGKDVLKEFRKLNDGDVIWERGQRAWRRRNEHDQPGRQQY